MKIALDISPISESSNSAHKVRGVGFYINMLVDNLEKFDTKNEYVFVTDNKFPKDADLIHYPYFDPFFLTLPPRFKTKTVVTVHDLTPLVFPDNFPVGLRGKLKWVLQRSRLKKADLILADSESSRVDVSRIGGVKKEKTRVVYLAADENFQKLKKGGWEDNIRDKYDLPKEFVLYVGDATWNKNLPCLVEAIKKTDLNLVMVGKVWGNKVSDVVSHPWNKDLAYVLKETEGDPQFTKIGFIPTEDLVKIYNMARVFAMPSLYEGFGLPVLEALVCGCAVVTSGGGSLFEVGGDAVLYADERNSIDIQTKIEHLFNYPKERLKLSRKGVEQSKKFSVKKMISDTIAAYESI